MFLTAISSVKGASENYKLRFIQFLSNTFSTTFSQHFLFVVTRRVGRAITQTISRRPPTAAARFRAQVRSCGNCGG
jgi:hypothetical protein